MKIEFETAVEQEETPAEENYITFTVKPKGYKGSAPEILHEFQMFEPSPGAMSLFAASTATGTSDADKISGLWAFLQSTMPEDDFSLIRSRVLSRKSGVQIDLERLVEIIQKGAEAFSGFPTSSSSVSSETLKPTGSGSGGRVRGPGSAPSRAVSKGS